MSIELHIHCPHRRRPIDTVVDNRYPAIGFQYLVANIIAIENGSWMYPEPFVTHGIKTFKKTRFSTQICLHSLMKIKMFMRNIGHDAYIKIASPHPVQFQSL